MLQVVDFDVRQVVVSNSTFGPNEIREIVSAISADFGNFRQLRDAVGELSQQEGRTPAASARLGVCQYLLGRYSDAVQTLTNAELAFTNLDVDGGALTHYFLGKSQLALEKYSEAQAAFESAETAGYNRDDVVLAKAEAMRYYGQVQESLSVLDGLSGAVEQTA